jgi:hypothetical protein
VGHSGFKLSRNRDNRSTLLVENKIKMGSLFTIAALVALGLAAPQQRNPNDRKKFIIGVNPRYQVADLGISARGSRYEAVRPIHTYNIGQWRGFAALLNENEWYGLRNDSRVCAPFLNPCCSSDDNQANCAFQVTYIEEDGILRTMQVILPPPFIGLPPVVLPGPPPPPPPQPPRPPQQQQQPRPPQQQPRPPQQQSQPRPRPEVVDDDLGSLRPSATDTRTQQNVEWGLSRISHKFREGGPVPYSYVYDMNAGEDTCSYTIDSGVYHQHAEFEGRATLIANFDQVDKSDEDLLGHGTHLAGIIGSRTFGVAKKTKIYAIKVCSQLGTCELSDVNAALQLVVNDSRSRNCRNGIVVNLSVGAQDRNWISLREAIREVTNAGIFVAVAAGNSNVDAQIFSPSSAPGACVAGAVDRNDMVAPFSNYGPAVSVFAPGVDVQSTWNKPGATVSAQNHVCEYLLSVG